MESTNLPIMNSDEVEMGSTDLQMLNSSEIETDHPLLNSDVGSVDLQMLNSNEVETDRSLLNSDVIDGNENNNYASNDDNIELQQMLFCSEQCDSGMNLESSPNNFADTEVVEMEVHFVYDPINLENSIHEKGESSYRSCVICEDVFPLPNTLMWGTNCNHYYCVECIQNYIGKKINKNANEPIVECPDFDCDGILDLASIMSIDYLTRVEDVFREMQALASATIVDCPFMDCTGTLMDDKKGYPIRACPKCWRIFCVRCRNLHLGMTCEDYEYSRQVEILYWQQFEEFKEYKEEGEGEGAGGEEEGEEEVTP